jgi:hypothetical protein
MNFGLRSYNGALPICCARLSDCAQLESEVVVAAQRGLAGRLHQLQRGPTRGAGRSAATSLAQLGRLPSLNGTRHIGWSSSTKETIALWKLIK